MKTAIVTGGAGGIGVAICEALTDAHYNVGVLDFDGAAAEAIARKLKGGVALQADVTDPDSVAAAVGRFGEVPDLLVNNAGITGFGGMQQDVATFRKILNVNVVGPFVMCRAVLPAMAKRGSGAVVNITSIGGIAPVSATGAYGPSKAALASLTRAMALEYASFGVRINAVAPGFINAGLGEKVYTDPERYAARVAMIPAGTLGSGKDIADTVVFLASDAARYIYGQEIAVDGGAIWATLTGSFKTAQG